jgi:hypothetical protein
MWIISGTALAAPSSHGKKYRPDHNLAGCCARDTLVRIVTACGRSKGVMT